MNEDFDHFPLNLSLTVQAILNPTFVRIRSSGPPEIDSSDDLSLFSMDALELNAGGSILATIRDDTESAASADMSSTIIDFFCTSDAVSVELWNPKVVEGLVACLKSLPTRTAKPQIHKAPILDRLPGGLTGAFSLFRVVFVATSPDLNLKNSLELSRGIALRATAISLQYSSMRPIHAYRFKHLPHRAQTRHLLGLPEERLMEAVSEARTSGITHSVSAFLAVSCSDISVRSSISTQYATDEPLIAEGDDPKLSHRDFLQIIGLRSDLTLSGKRGSTLTTMPDSCQVSIRVPYVHGTFRILHLYSTLLASQTLRRLVNAKPPVVRISPESATSSFQLSYTVTGALRTVQVLCLLPKQRIALRVDSITAKMALNSPTEVHWHRAVGWVPLASRINKWQTDVGEQWHELVCLRRWSMFLQSSPSSISVEGHSLHFHIPFGYVLANLIQDVGVTVKVLRHLIRITNSGRYSAMGFPQPEGPKVVPTVSFHISCICAEAHDDWLDSKLNNIWRCGVTAVPMRADREEAFLAKVAAVIAAEYDDDEQPAYGFSSRHSVSVEEARHRLDQVHVLDWMLRLENLTKDQTEAEDKLKRHLQGASPSRIAKSIPDIVKVVTLPEIPPLFRAVLDGLSLTISPPSFAMVDLPQFLHDQGGLKTDTEYSLLVPLHINFTLSSLRVTLRDYPLPLIDVPAVSRGSKAALEFDSDVVIAEEMGTEFSIDWVKCPIIDDSEAQTDGSVPFFSMVPKTIMPVKSYANAEINVTTSGSSTFAWAVSYGPAIQDLMRIVDTLSNSPRDPSPAIGFWDKMRLILHWTIKATFKGDVYYYIKGTRDPYQMLKSGAGFVLVFQGHPELLIGRQNDDRELVQLTSGSMLIAIPDLGPRSRYSRKPDPDHYPFTKICAKFRAGVRFGDHLFIVPADSLISDPIIRLNSRTDKGYLCSTQGPEDSYAGFRSEFIHMSISLTSSLDATKSRLQAPSSLHLTPQSFAHFWSWWTLFEGALSLPIRQGTYFPARVLSPKFGRHIATIKYRLTVPKLFVMHGYMDESPETWMDAVTPWIGVKAMIDELQVDMHQREQEMLVSASSTNKKNRRKPFYAAEVVLKGLDLRAVLSTFPDPLKQTITVLGTHERSNYRSQQDLPVLDLSSFWYDPDDFIELDWSPKERPTLHILPFVECPQFMYFKRNTATVEDDTATSKFGNEDTHRCLLGKEPSAPQVQIALATARVHELKDAIQHGRTTTHGKGSSLQKMVSLLEQYIAHLEETESGQVSTTNHYQMPSDTVSPDEWAEFDNVYHIHCPKIVMDTAIRDIMMQYYYCSRSRRGVEYHMATRAVKFIRDQAEAGLARGAHVSEKYKGSANTAQAAALALRKMLIGDDGNTPQDESKLDILDPLNGWSEGVSLTKSHCCLLLKPQIVLKNRDAAEETCIVAAVQAKLQSFAIMDDYNADDPISGKVITYTLLSGLQTFAPTKGCRSNDNSVPLEVLIDFRCESSDFDRLVPQADATFHYDKFNRLRLRNNVTSVISRHSSDSPGNHPNHLQDQTDLIQIHIPRFTVMANEANFQTISNITRLDTLETMLFTYDFTDLGSQAAKLVSDLQGRLRASLESQNDALFRTALGDEAEHITTPPLSDMELLSMRYHISTAYQHLAMIFDVIKLAQDRHDEQGDQKSALLVNASSSEISWRMLDDNQDLLAKLAVQDIDYSWLSRQDSTTVNNLTIGNLQAFDGSANAKWTEILSKYDDFSGHALAKRGLFLMSNWVVLPPVAGITIYESFELTLHPIRLQVDAKVGSRIMEYLYPSRRQQRIAMESIPSTELVPRTPLPPRIQAATRASLDSPRPAYSFSDSLYTDSSESLAPPPLRRLGVSRSFTDLRTSAAEYLYATAPGIQRTRSTEALQPPDQGVSPLFETTEFKPGGVIYKRPERTGDAAEMKTRSSQKSFVMVKVSSLSLLLSIMKEDSFVCRDARIRTRDLEYHNQTWSFEELVDQFIPSDMSWKGWVKMALHQPLVPVLPVARELIAKTKWLGSRAEVGEALDSFPGARAITFGAEVPSPAPSPPRLLKQTHFLTSEPEPVSEQHPSRKRVDLLVFVLGAQLKPISILVGFKAKAQILQRQSNSFGNQAVLESAVSLHSRDDAIAVDIIARSHHNDQIVDHLEVLDNQISTVSSLTNAANSILIPPLPWYSRKPVVILSSPPQNPDEEQGSSEFDDDLDRHVEDLLKNPSRIRRTLKGVWSFLKTLVLQQLWARIVTAIYGFLVAFWGAAIVIFLAKIINLHNADTQGFWVEVSSQVENGLFTITGIGLIPSRVLDTYRIYKIWHYKRKTRRLRKIAGLPELFDIDDLPDPVYDPNYVHVLTDEEQHDLHRQQVKFQHHQTWYRAHGTETHRAFPINTALLICCLNDGNSIFQIMLCATMWSLNRFQRPAWSTGCLIPASFLCGIFAAVFIARGGHKTRRTQKVEDGLRAVLAAEKNRRHPVESSNNDNDNVQSKVVSRAEKVPPSPDPILDAVVEEHMIIPATIDTEKLQNGI
ncbi:RNA pol II promoter Fmp27 protein domain-containing protein [Mycena floridula]|nr:RNA pol II promoter Fmp27 protein domain-containing protein [Mycena floridula]